VTASYINSSWPAWSFPTKSFWFGQYDYSSKLSYYENLTSTEQVQVMLSTDYPGIGLPQQMYSQYVAMLQNITSSNFNCSLVNGTYPLGSNCRSTTNSYNTTTLESLNFYI